MKEKKGGEGRGGGCSRYGNGKWEMKSFDSIWKRQKHKTRIEIMRHKEDQGCVENQSIPTMDTHDDHES